MTAAIITVHAASVETIASALLPEARIIIGSERRTNSGRLLIVTAPEALVATQAWRLDIANVGTRTHSTWADALAHTQAAHGVDWSTLHDPTGERILAVVQPQYWHNDYALDAGAAITFDITEHVLALTAEERAAIEDNDYTSDELYQVAKAARAVPEHSGPFYVHVEESIRDYFDAARVAA